MGRKVPLPPHVRATLYRLFGDAVDLVEIVEHSWFTKLHGRAHATTRRRRIYLRGSAADFFDDPVLIRFQPHANRATEIIVVLSQQDGGHPYPLILRRL